MLVNTVGGFLLGEAVSATPDDLRAMMDVNPGIDEAGGVGGPAELVPDVAQPLEDLAATGR